MRCLEPALKAWVERRSIQAVGQADASGQSDVPAEESEKPAEEHPLERTREWRCLLLAHAGPMVQMG